MGREERGCAYLLHNLVLDAKLLEDCLDDEVSVRKVAGPLRRRTVPIRRHLVIVIVIVIAASG